MSDTVLKTIELTKRYKNRVVVDHLNLEVRRGDIFGFLGPNGAGKSTTIRMILHLVFPTEGDVEIFGASLSKARHKAIIREKSRSGNSLFRADVLWCGPCSHASYPETNTAYPGS